MGTFRGKDSWLAFRCKDCEERNTRSEIMIDPCNKEDLISLGRWLEEHSNNGGVYETIDKRDMKIPERPERPKQLQVLHEEMEKRHKK